MFLCRYFFVCLVGLSSWGLAKQPNIVFMIADDCTFRDIGCYGGQAYTPNIDKLADQGMRFTRCFQAAPMCSPTRHNIYTGIYPIKSGAYPNHTRVNAGTKSIVHHLSDLGYRVAHSGKSHVGPAAAFPWEELKSDAKNPDFAVVDAFLKDCEQNAQPFCLLLCSNEPHTPWDRGDPSRYPVDQIELPPYFIDTPEIREAMSRYLAEITYYDDQVGQAVQLIEKHGMTNDTLLMVVSEQGSSMPFAKWTCYDSGLQSACLVRWPGKIEAGSVNPAMIEYIDFLPTFIEAAGGTPDVSLSGKSLLPVFAGKTSHKRFVFGEMTTRGINNGSDYYGIRSVRSEQYKYIWNFTPDVKFSNACVGSPEFQSWIARAKAGDDQAAEFVRRYQHRPAIELYDVINDPFELRNLAEHPGYEAVKQELRFELDQWMAACGDQGQQTELDALRHTVRGAPKSPKQQQKDLPAKGKKTKKAGSG
ncbi:MAG: sulfatase [Pirellulaceae bacterium]